MSDFPVELRRSALSRAFRDPIVPPTGALRENRSVAFADLVRMMAEGIADAQTELDRASAAMIVELAGTPVEVVRSVTETIKADGSIEVEPSEPVTMSLLELGVQPTFYQFSESTIEVAMDLEINEEIESEDDTETKVKGRKALFARTRNIREERKLNRDVSVSSKITAKLVPVPSPVSLDVVRNTIVEEPAPDDGGDGGGDGDGGDGDGG
jgi:hypothetical protein